MRLTAKILSFLFHPIFILPYLCLISYFICSHLFSIMGEGDFLSFIINSVSSGLVIPIIGIFMMKNLGIIKSWEMDDRHERIGPLILTGLLYAWLFYNYYQSSGTVPEPVTMVTLGATIALFLAFFLNNFYKLSLHGVGMGGLLMGTTLIAMNWSYGYVSIADLGIHFILILVSMIVLVGLVLSSRLYLGSHSLNEIYHGFLVGIFGQIIALRIIL